MPFKPYKMYTCAGLLYVYKYNSGEFKKKWHAAILTMLLLPNFTLRYSFIDFFVFPLGI